MSPSIRPLEARDKVQWNALWTAYLAFYKTELSAQHVESYFARLLSEDPHDFSALVYEEDGELLGLTHYLFHRHGWKSEPVCYLQDLYTQSHARGKGVATALIKAVYQAADTRGAPTVYWLTQTDNHAARLLYDKIARESNFIKYERA